MSTISNIAGTPTVLPLGNDAEATQTEPAITETAPAPAPEQTSPAAPLFANSFAGQTNALRLGLAPPRGNIGDAEALFAQIAAALKELQSESKDNEYFARSSQRLTNVSGAAAPLQQLVALNLSMMRDEVEISEQEVKIGIINEKLVPLEAEKTRLEGEVSSLNGRISSKESLIEQMRLDIVALEGQIKELDDEIILLQADRTYHNGRRNNMSLTQAQRNFSQQEYDRLRGVIQSKTEQRNQLNSNLTAKVKDRNDLIGEVGALKAERDILQTELDGVNEQIDLLEAEKGAAFARIATLEQSIQNSFASFVPIFLGAFLFTLATQLQARGEQSRESFGVRVYGDAFEDTLQQITADLRRLVQEKVAEEFVEENAMLGLGDPRFDQGDGVAIRFGAIQPSQTLAMGFASGIASIIGTLRVLLEQSEKAPQPPDDLARAGAARMRVAI